jgi:hypothetical protein
MLLWSDFERVDYHSRTTSIRRVSPNGLRKSVYHREFWCTSQLEFCPETWDVLLSRCPKCGKDLEWDVTRVDRCGRCMFDLKLSVAPSVPQDIRPPLRLMANLLSRDRRTREAARQKTPPEFQSFSPFIIFDLAVLFGCAQRPAGADDLRSRAPLHGQRHEPVVLAEGARILLDYPASFRRLFQEEANTVTPEFFRKMRRFGHLARPVSKRHDELARKWEPISHGPSRLRRNRRQAGKWTLREAAAHLGIQNSQVRMLINDQLMEASRPRGARRTCQWIDPKEVHRVGGVLADRISLERSSQVLALPVPGIEQLVEIGVLRPNRCPVIRSVHLGRNYYWTEVKELIHRLEINLCEPAAPNLKMVTLEELFYGIGAQPKPWATFVSAIMDGKIPVYFAEACPGRTRIRALRVTDEFAREVVARRRPELLHVPPITTSNFFGVYYSRSEAACHMTAGLAGFSGFAAIPATALDPPLRRLLRRSRRFRVPVPILWITPQPGPGPSDAAATIDLKFSKISAWRTAKNRSTSALKAAAPESRRR